MTTRPRTAVRGKLIASMMATSTIVLLLTGVALVVYDAVSFRKSLAQSLVTRSQILAANSTAALAFQNPEDAAQVLSALHSDTSMVMGAIYDRDGRLFARYPVNASSSRLPPGPMPGGYHFKQHTVAIFQPIVEKGRWLGTLYLESSLHALDQRLRVYTMLVLAAIIGSTGVAFAISSWLQRGIAQPIGALAEVAREVSEKKDFALRARVMSDDEIGLLTESFNDMLDEIEARDLAVRRMNVDLERRVQERTAQFQESNRELEAFSYSVSHDLRAPLRHIDGFADLLQRHAQSSLDEKGRRYLATISESAKSMGVLIDDLLAFSRMGRSELQHTTVDLNQVVDEVRRELDAEIAGRDIEWRIAVLPHVQADPAMLRQVLVNLISNALKYSRSRERAIIEIGAEESTEITFWVRDNGVGFDPAYTHKLFGVFQRLHRADEFEGTGIGLANVRRIIHRHGGKTWAEGELGKGAAFFCSLPRIVSPRTIVEEAA